MKNIFKHPKIIFPLLYSTKRRITNLVYFFSIICFRHHLQPEQTNANWIQLQVLEKLPSHPTMQHLSKECERGQAPLCNVGKHFHLFDSSYDCVLTTTTLCNYMVSIVYFRCGESQCFPVALSVILTRTRLCVLLRSSLLWLICSMLIPWVLSFHLHPAMTLLRGSHCCRRLGKMCCFLIVLFSCSAKSCI